MTIPETPSPATRLYHSSWFLKFVECLFAAIAIINVLAMSIEILPESILMKIGEKVFGYLLLGQVVLGLLFGLGYALYWHRKERRGRINSPVKHAWMRGILRYWLALEIATYGFAKILKTQFGASYHRADATVGSLSGFDLTWNYFAYSYTLAVIIGLLQVTGAILLLFRRTTLLGVAILLPVMVNITLINVFYQIAPGAFMNSVLFTLGLFFLLMLRRSALLKVFFRTSDDLPSLRLGLFKSLGRILAIGTAFSLIYYFVSSNPASTLAGKWKVDRMVRNRDTLKADAWFKDSTAWTTVYMEERGSVAFCANPYVYDNGRSVWARFKYDSSRHLLQLIYENNDTVNAAVSHYNGRHMELGGIAGKDTIFMSLSRIDKKK